MSYPHFFLGFHEYDFHKLSPVSPSDGGARSHWFIMCRMAWNQGKDINDGRVKLGEWEWQNHDESIHPNTMAIPGGRHGHVQVVCLKIFLFCATGGCKHKLNRCPWKTTARPIAHRNLYQFQLGDFDRNPRAASHDNLDDVCWSDCKAGRNFFRINAQVSSFLNH